MGTNTKECVWQKMRNDLFQHLVGMQLSKRRLSDYNWIFNKLKKFMQSRKENSYSLRIGKAFTKVVLPLDIIDVGSFNLVSQYPVWIIRHDFTSNVKKQKTSSISIFNS